MDRKKVSLAVLSIAIGSLAVAYVAASSQILNTPLYTFRMEQQSSEMNFLPTEMNTFAYVTEKGYNLSCSIVGKYCGVNPLSTSPASTCNPSCFDTCEDTCEWTCFETCGCTCPATCDDPTCAFTCGVTHWETCPATCDDPTCVFTCESTHWETCNPCIP